LRAYLLCILCFSVEIVGAQEAISFIEKWNASQLKADSIARTFVVKYPDIKHLKVNYKRFYDNISYKEVVLDMYVEIPEGKGFFPVVVFVTEVF